MKKKSNSKPLKICLLTYRGNPNCGGQGVYIKYLSKALSDLGHEVDVLSGPPYPHLDSGVHLHKLPSLDLYNAEHPFRVKKVSDLTNPLNMYEFITMCTGQFPEPYTFGVRAYNYLQKHKMKYDIVHDNQCLAYGIGKIAQNIVPTIATIHHPITVDRTEEFKAATTRKKIRKIKRWYSFIKMQKEVARQLSHIVTVSECSKIDIAQEFSINLSKFRVVPNGVNREIFYPVHNESRPENSIIVTNSADTPLKGLRYLLEAVAMVKKKQSVKLTVIGEPKKNGIIKNLVSELGIEDVVHFTGRIQNEEFAGYYSRATIAVVPSLYEGFGMPASEAMACGVPVISTSGGALPEVVGDTGIIVPPADANALAREVMFLLNHPDQRKKMAQAGIKRVDSIFNWLKAANDMVDVYREAIDGYRRSA
ncbi:MAG: glycosyltransferase family 4 protein [Deltaproteobacteria bacterium]|nr:glycosyltransferase family 4 protein [Deltaproteobacteria bacterium]